MFSDYQDCENRNDNDDNNNVWWMCNVEKKTAAYPVLNGNRI